MSENVMRLDRAAFILAASGHTPPPEGVAGWTPVRLPDSWRETRPGKFGLGWYRFRVPRPAARRQLWGLYLPSLNMTADAFVNGESVGSGGSLTGDVARNFSAPLYFVFPSALLDRDENLVDVVLSGVDHNFPSLAPGWLGPDRELYPTYSTSRFLRGTLPWLETFLSLSMAGLMLALWGSSRERVYATFALVCALYALVSANYWLTDPPFDFWTWERVVHAALFNFATTLALWSRYFLRLAGGHATRLLVGLGALGALIIALVPVPSFLSTVQWLNVIILAVATYACASLVFRGRHLGRGEFVSFALGSLASLLIGLHDVAINLGWLGAGSMHLMPHLIPVFVLTFGTSLVRRFALSLRTAEDVNRVLEQRVEQKRREIEEAYRLRRALEHERLLSSERDRMIKEMHDGLGSQLTSTLALVECGRGDSQRLSAALRAALQEMRLVINSLDAEPRGIAEVLGALRPRLEPSLEDQNVQLVWRVDHPLAERQFGNEESLHVLRIVQEAISNSLKHGAVSRIEVSVVAVPEQLTVSVADNGRGFRPDAVKPGRGLAHMRERARSLQGDLRVLSNAPGTLIQLIVPNRVAGVADSGTSDAAHR